MNRFVFMLFLLFFIPLALEAKPFQQLQESLDYDLQTAEALQDVAFFLPYHDDMEGLALCLKKANTLSSKKEAPKVYLRQLRRCEKRSNKFDAHYVHALREVISKNDTKLFRSLIEANPRILQRDRWREGSVKFYKSNRDDFTFPAGEKLLKAYEVEEDYRHAAALEMANYEANVKVLSYHEAKKSRDKNGKVRKFFVGYKKRNGVIVLIAENRNVYPVTLTVKLRNLKNYKVDKKSPYHVEVDPSSTLEVMHLRVENRHKVSRVGWQYSWVMGRRSAQHDASFAYGLPFALGSRVIVSQGFNGTSTHTGNSRYAIDFVADVGTRIYAARGGRVVATEASFNQGGFEKSFGKYANYITIEHVDKTLGKYYHLQQNGVKVSVGQYVSKGQFIGLSGNTGYSSGPHLHFGVYTVADDYSTSTTVPFILQTNRGIVTAPKKGDIFKVVR